MAIEKTMIDIINQNRRLLALFEKLREEDPSRTIADQVRAGLHELGRVLARQESD